jgi:hypothetical protein
MRLTLLGSVAATGHAAASPVVYRYRYPESPRPTTRSGLPPERPSKLSRGERHTSTAFRVDQNLFPRRAEVRADHSVFEPKRLLATAGCAFDTLNVGVGNLFASWLSDDDLFRVIFRNAAAHLWKSGLMEQLQRATGVSDETELMDDLFLYSRGGIQPLIDGLRNSSWSSDTFRDYDRDSPVLTRLSAAIHDYLNLLADETRPLAKYLPDFWRSPENYRRIFTPVRRLEFSRRLSPREEDVLEDEMPQDSLLKVLGVLRGRRMGAVMKIRHQFTPKLWLSSDSLLDMRTGQEAKINGGNFHVLPQLCAVLEEKVDESGQTYYALTKDGDLVERESGRLPASFSLVAITYNMELKKVWIARAAPGFVQTDTIVGQPIPAEKAELDARITGEFDELTATYGSQGPPVYSNTLESRTSSCSRIEIFEAGIDSVAVVDTTNYTIKREIQHFLHRFHIERSAMFSEEQMRLFEIAYLLLDEEYEEKGWAELVRFFHGRPFSTNEAKQAFINARRTR